MSSVAGLRTCRAIAADPQLVKALSTHCDRRARQPMNQQAVAEGINTGEVSDNVRIFLNQSLTSAEWGTQRNLPPAER